MSLRTRCLALGYRIVKVVETAEAEGYREVARRMGVSHTRVSVLAALTQLSSRIQESILLDAEDQLGFHTLLRIARMEGWKAQEAMAKAEIRRQRLWVQTLGSVIWRANPARLLAQIPLRESVLVGGR